MDAHTPILALKASVRMECSGCFGCRCVFGVYVRVAGLERSECYMLHVFVSMFMLMFWTKKVGFRYSVCRITFLVVLIVVFCTLCLLVYCLLHINVLLCYALCSVKVDLALSFTYDHGLRRSGPGLLHIPPRSGDDSQL